jgi:PAS domain S-box-containing protein
MALVIFAVAGLDKTHLWLNVFANLMAWAGLGFYARGTRQFVGLTPTPFWMVAVYLLATLATIILTILTPYGPGIRIITGSAVFAVYSFDLVASFLRLREMRSAPSYFIAFVFLVFGITHTVRGLETCFDPTLMAYQRPVDKVLIFVGILGWGAIATGFSMLTTQRLLNERARNLRQLEEGVEHLREHFVGLASGDYSVRAQTAGTSEPMDVVGQLFNDTAANVEQAFEEIERQRSVLSATQESMLDGLLLIDDKLEILSVNPALVQLLEWGEGTIAGRPLSDLLAADDREFAASIMKSVSSAPIRERPTHFRTEDGSSLTLAVNASAHRDSGGQVSGAVLVVRDNRELNEAQAQLQMTDRLAAMGTVAAGVAHEINNPLAFVLSNVEFAIEEIDDLKGQMNAELRDELLHALAAAQEGSERVRQIVSDLKNFTRSEGESQGLVEVNQLVESAAAMLRNEVRHHALLELSLSGNPLVQGNEAKLGQVFLNLIHNAAQAIPLGHAKKNVIRVSTVVEDEQVIVEVSDTGDGIAPENLDRIFDAFFTTKAVGVGTGLGLAICHRVVTGLGGSIEVSSEVGKGTSFRVTLPVADAPTESNATDEDSAPAPPAMPKRVLVIDDEAEVGFAARRILSKVHEVDVVQSARDALARLKSTDYDVIFCDLMMPEMTGMQLFSEIREQCPDAADRVVFMSGGTFGPSGEEFLRTVPNPTITKPFDTATLRRAVSGSSHHKSRKGDAEAPPSRDG